MLCGYQISIADIRDSPRFKEEYGKHRLNPDAACQGTLPRYVEMMEVDFNARYVKEGEHGFAFFQVFEDAIPFDLPRVQDKEVESEEMAPKEPKEIVPEDTLEPAYFFYLEAGWCGGPEPVSL